MREECYWVRKKAKGIGLFLDKDDGVASARSYLAVPSRVSNVLGKCLFTHLFHLFAGVRMNEMLLHLNSYFGSCFFLLSM